MKISVKTVENQMSRALRKKANKMADYIIDSQFPNGALPYRLDINIDRQDGVISEKGMAIWFLLLYRLYDYTKNEKYLEAARRCLSWCMGNQYCGNDIKMQKEALLVYLQHRE